MFCKIIVFIDNELKLSIIQQRKVKTNGYEKTKKYCRQGARTQANRVEIQPPTTDLLTLYLLAIKAKHHKHTDQHPYTFIFSKIIIKTDSM
jgi:hypothetical protein